MSEAVPQRTPRPPPPFKKKLATIYVSVLLSCVLRTLSPRTLPALSI